MYLFMDTETGGLDPSTPILEAYFCLTTEKLEVVKELHLFCKPDNGIYNIEPEALKINKIDLVEHDKKAEVYEVCKKKIYEFLKLCCQEFGGAKNIIPVGNNVFFDIEKIQRHWLTKKTMDQFVSYRVIDLKAIWMYLQAVGILPAELKASSEAMAQYFKVAEAREHAAKGDVFVDMLIFLQLIDMGKYYKRCGETLSKI